MKPVAILTAVIATVAALASTGIPAATAATTSRVLLPVVSVHGVDERVAVQCVTAPCPAQGREYISATALIPSRAGECFTNFRGRLTTVEGSSVPVLSVTARRTTGNACTSTGGGSTTVEIDLYDDAFFPKKVKDAKTGKVFPVYVAVAN